MAGISSRPDGLSDPGDLLKALESAAEQAQWVPVFSDDFGRTELGDDWRIIGGQAQVQNGWLRVSGRADCYAVIRRPFSDNVRIEFDARFPNGQRYCSDLACFVAGDERRCDAVGYCLSFGADGNNCSRIQREGMDVRINTRLVAERGRTYRLAAELLDGELRLEVDGATVLRYVDLVPLAGVGHDHLGLVTFQEGCEFSNVRVMSRAGQSEAGVFTIPDAYCRDGLFDRAIDRYRQVASTHPGGALELQAQTKIGLALLGAGRHSEAEAQLRNVSRQAQGTEMALLVELWRGLALGMMGKLDEALRAFSHVQSQSSDPGVIDEVAVACGRLSSHLKREERWLEAGRCAKFLFENLKTPLIETPHMFQVYEQRLRDAGLYDEVFQAASRLTEILSKRDESIYLEHSRFGAISAAVYAGRTEEAGRMLDALQELSGGANDEGLRQRLAGYRAILSMASGKYQKAMDILAGLPVAGDPEARIGDGRWGQTASDLRSAGAALLGRVDEALASLRSGRVSGEALDLRLALGAELRKQGDEAAAVECLSELSDGLVAGSLVRFAQSAVPVICGDMAVDEFRDRVDSSLQPSLQPLGIFVSGLALWAGGDEQAALLAWAEARSAAADTDPAWHWSSLYLDRVGKRA